MLTTDWKQLRAAGWLLAVVALAGTVLVWIPLGGWALEAIDRSAIRAWRAPIILLLAGRVSRSLRCRAFSRLPSQPHGPL